MHNKHDSNLEKKIPFLKRQNKMGGGRHNKGILKPSGISEQESHYAISVTSESQETIATPCLSPVLTFAHSCDLELTNRRMSTADVFSILLSQQSLTHSLRVHSEPHSASG